MILIYESTWNILKDTGVNYGWTQKYAERESIDLGRAFFQAS